MKDLSHALNHLRQGEALRYHLNVNFYPPIPGEVKDEFVAVFTEYWNGELEAGDLNVALAERTGYVGGIEQYDFWQFLNECDLEEEY